MRRGVRGRCHGSGLLCAQFLTDSSTMQELEPPHQRQLLTEALKDLVVIAQETQCPPETVRRLEMLHKCIMFDTIEGLRGKCPFGGGHASYLRVLLSMALLTRSTVLALSIDDKDKGRIPDALVSRPGRTRHSGS
jgi:hypothetical protein